MPKQKSKRALRKRVRVTGSGRLRRYHAYKSHILTKKHPKRKRHLRKAALVSHADERRLKRLLMAEGAAHAPRQEQRRAPAAQEQDHEARQGLFWRALPDVGGGQAGSRRLAQEMAP